MLDAGKFAAHRKTLPAQPGQNPKDILSVVSSPPNRMVRPAKGFWRTSSSTAEPLSTPCRRASITDLPCRI